MKSAWSTLLLAAALGTISAPSAQAGLGHCLHGWRQCPQCVVCCPNCGQQPSRESRDAEPVSREAVQVAPLVQSVPMFAMPMVSFMPTMPTMPMVNTAAQPPSRGAERSAIDDCCERVDALEVEMKKLAESVRQLQGIVNDQTQLLERLYQQQQPGAAGGATPAPMPPAPASNGTGGP